MPHGSGRIASHKNNKEDYMKFKRVTDNSITDDMGKIQITRVHVYGRDVFLLWGGMQFSEDLAVGIPLACYPTGDAAKSGRY